MINAEQLGKKPFRERDLIPIASDEQAIERFQERIEDIRREVKSPIRAIHYRHANPLLHISGEEQYSVIGGRNHGRFRLDAIRVERSRAQELLFRVMGAYGFDQAKSEPHFIYSDEVKRFVKNVTVHQDGTTREVTLFPSQITRGLVFERVRSSVTETGETTDVWWNVVDEGPLINLKNIKNIFRQDKPHIFP